MFEDEFPYVPPAPPTGRVETPPDEPEIPVAVLWVPFPDRFGWQEFKVQRRNKGASKPKGWGFQ